MTHPTDPPPPEQSASQPPQVPASAPLPAAPAVDAPGGQSPAAAASARRSLLAEHLLREAEHAARYLTRTLDSLDRTELLDGAASRQQLHAWRADLERAAEHLQEVVDLASELTYSPTSEEP